MGFKARGNDSLDRWWSLTDRQRQIGLMMMGGDMSREEMANALGVGLKTVDSHRLTLLGGLGLANAVQLVHFGVRHKLIRISTK
ncbi:MAG: hypothetical protein GY811_26210 [Myxococcales bacterium]|nr:hypothetical protein [Myxococcales bacterium]